jgi:hypothetical protein
MGEMRVRGKWCQHFPLTEEETAELELAAAEALGRVEPPPK